MAKKKQVNRVGLLLDESGSMSSRRDETIKAVNEYFVTLRNENAIVTFATFDTAQNVRFRETGVKASDIADLTTENYRPNAGTPLYDAVGKMLNTMTDQAGDKDKVLIIVVTDGQENSSGEFSLDKVKELIAKFESHDWAFAYVGAAPSAWSGAGAMGVSVGNSLPVADSAGQVQVAFAVNSLATSDYFAGRVSSRSLYTGRQIHKNKR